MSRRPQRDAFGRSGSATSRQRLSTKSKEPDDGNPTRRHAAAHIHRGGGQESRPPALRGHRAQGPRDAPGRSHHPARADGIRSFQSIAHGQDPASLRGFAHRRRNRGQRGENQRVPARARRDDGQRSRHSRTGPGAPVRPEPQGCGAVRSEAEAPFTSSKLAQVPRGVWALGFVSMFMDLSSEMIHALLPVYLVTVLGASALTVGFIEGIAEATANITKIFSGALSDRLGERKLLAAIGYGLAASAKPVFPLASSVGWLVAARFIDRVGKGIRGAPRDALVADITPESLRGASFGLRQSLDTVGAFVGPLLAIGLMWWTADNFKAVFWFAVIPAFLSL